MNSLRARGMERLAAIMQGNATGSARSS